MALPIITIHDDAGDLIPTGTPLVLPTATPGTPGVPVIFRIRNNDAAGPAVDPSLDTKVTALGKLLGGPGEVGSELPYLVQGAFELSVTAVSGGATAQLGGFQPQGGGRALSVSTIPDGGEVELEARTSASLAASSTNVELSITVESTQSTPGSALAWEINGNFVYNGRVDGDPDPVFAEIFSEAGDWSVNGPADEKLNTPTKSVYYLSGDRRVFEPVPAEIEFDDLDGSAAELVAGKAYYAGLSYKDDGTVTVVKGDQADVPLTDGDKPEFPEGEIGRIFVPVEFNAPGLGLVNTFELVGDFGFFYVAVVSGLDVVVSHGRALVGGRWVDTETQTFLTLLDDTASRIWRLAETGYEITAQGTLATDPRAMAIRDMTTAAGVVTIDIDQRRIGQTFSTPQAGRIVGELDEVNISGAGGPHITMPTAGVPVGWTTGTAGLAEGGIVVDDGNPTASTITVPIIGVYQVAILATCSGTANTVFDGQLYINGSTNGIYVPIQIGSGGPVSHTFDGASILLDAGDELSVRWEADSNTRTLTIWVMRLEVFFLREP